MIQHILDWFKTAKPKPDAEDVNIQFGCHVEEFAELLEAVGERKLADELHYLAMLYKRNERSLALRLQDRETRVAVLDAIADQVVTGIGVGHMAGMDILGALTEVNRANWSKFEDGRPVFDEHGKIRKGSAYSPPVLDRFVGVGK